MGILGSIHLRRHARYLRILLFPRDIRTTTSPPQGNETTKGNRAPVPYPMGHSRPASRHKAQEQSSSPILDASNTTDNPNDVHLPSIQFRHPIFRSNQFRIPLDREIPPTSPSQRSPLSIPGNRVHARLPSRRPSNRRHLEPPKAQSKRKNRTRIPRPPNDPRHNSPPSRSILVRVGSRKTRTMDNSRHRSSSLRLRPDSQYPSNAAVCNGLV